MEQERQMSPNVGPSFSDMSSDTSMKLREVAGWWWGGGCGDQVRAVAASTSAVKVEGVEGDVGFNKSSSSNVFIHVRM